MKVWKCDGQAVWQPGNLRVFGKLINVAKGLIGMRVSLVPIFLSIIIFFGVTKILFGQLFFLSKTNLVG